MLEILWEPQERDCLAVPPLATEGKAQANVGHGLGPFSTVGLEPKLTGQETSVEVPVQGPKPLGLGAHLRASSLLSRKSQNMALAGRVGHPLTPTLLAAHR